MIDARGRKGIVCICLLASVNYQEDAGVFRGWVSRIANQAMRWGWTWRYGDFTTTAKHALNISPRYQDRFNINFIDQRRVSLMDVNLRFRSSLPVSI